MRPLGHQPGLDGLRALAVGAVLLYHARFGWATGGFLGVSLFFTLSGFLITSLLLREGATTGTVDLRRFWTRRFRRLLPAAWATIAAVVLMGLAGVWNTDQLRDLRGDVPFALAQVVNWHFILQRRSYGAAFQAPSPLEHYWSLAIEEQFYLLLPLVVVGLLALERRRGGRSVRFLATAFLLLGGASVLLNGMLARSGTDAAYFGTFSRIFELLAGALLACVLIRGTWLRARTARAVATWGAAAALGVTVVFWHVATVGSPWMYPTGFLVVAACSCALILGAMQGGFVTRLLELRPLVWLGGISYGVYLIHWPVFLWLTPERVGWLPWPLFALRMAVTLTLAVCMFRLLERPVRVGGLLPARRARVVAPATIVAVLLGTAMATADLPPPTNLQRAAAETTTLPPRPLQVTFVGDRLAASLDGHADVGGRSPMHATVLSAPDCGLATGGWVRRSDGTFERDSDRCGDVRSALIDRITGLHPDVVVVWAGSRDLADRRMSPESPWAGPGTPQIDEFLTVDVSETLRQLVATGAQVVALSTPPLGEPAAPPPAVPTTMPSDPTRAALLGTEIAQIGEGIPPAASADDGARLAAWNAVLAASAAKAGATYLDAAAEIATWPGGALDQRWRLDGLGLTPAGARRLARWLSPQLRDLRPVVAAPAPPSALSGGNEVPPAPAPTPHRPVPPGGHVNVAVVGDSVALGIYAGLRHWATGTGVVDVANAAKLGCPIARGGDYRHLLDVATFRPECDWSGVFPGFVRDQRPDVVVLMSGIWEVVDRRFPGDDRWRHIGDPEVDAYILKEFVAAIDVLGSSGASVVVLTYPHFQHGADQGYMDLPESDPTRVDRLNEILRQAVALRPGVARIIDLQAWYASQPGGELDRSRRPDGLHFADGYAPMIGAWLGPQLLAIAHNP